VIRLVRDASAVVLATFVSLAAIGALAYSLRESDRRNWEQHRRSEDDRRELREREKAAEARVEANRALIEHLIRRVEALESRLAAPYPER
jgi:hypothetical protein